MAVRPRTSSSRIVNVEYLPRTTEDQLQSFRRAFGYGPEGTIGPFWQTVAACIELGNKKDVDAIERFREIYKVPFPTDRKEQAKYIKAALQLEKTSMDQLMDYAEKNGYPLETIAALKEEVPSIEEMKKEEQTFFDDSQGVEQIRGAVTNKSGDITQMDSYQKIMDALNYGISLTSNKNRFFVHTIFEEIPEYLRKLPPRVHIRIITMIPYEFDAGTGNPGMDAGHETHATIIISDISDEGVKRMCFAEANRIMWKQLFYRRTDDGLFHIDGNIVTTKEGKHALRQSRRKPTTLKTYIDDKFDKLFSRNVQNFLELFTTRYDILEQNLNFLKAFAEGAEKYFLDLPVYNDYGPNCVRLCIYFMFYYCFVSTRSDELQQFAIKITPEGKLTSLRLKMGEESRTFDKIKPFLYGLLRAKEKNSSFELTDKFEEAYEKTFDPEAAKDKEDKEDPETVEEKLRQNLQPSAETEEDEEETPRKRRKRGGRSYRCHEHLY